MEALIKVLRLLADGVIGPRVHELLDELEAPGAPDPAVPVTATALLAPPAPPTPGGSK